MEDSSDNEGEDDDLGGENDEWGPGDDAPVNHVHGGVNEAEGSGGADNVDGVDAIADGVHAAVPKEPSIPRQSNCENRGVPPLRFM